MCKKIITLILIVSMTFCGCTPNINNKGFKDIEEKAEFTALDDIKLQEHINDSIYSNIGAYFQNDDYIIKDITSIYISKEYLEEIEYNSKSNVYFGFTLEELQKQFNGKKYAFKLGDNNETTVSEFEEYDDVYMQMIKNVAIGSGVILICTTISAVTTGTSISVIFAVSAKTATELALSSATVSSFISTAVNYYQAGDINNSIELGLLEGSESFKWGAIIGAVTGGFTESLSQYKLEKHVKSTDPVVLGRESEAKANVRYGGRNQISYLNGEEVGTSEQGATRPDIVRIVDGKLEAIEVKNYNLMSAERRYALYAELKRQITDRVQHLPKGSTQRIVLDASGRNYSKSLIDEVIAKIRSICQGVYPNIPVDVMLN